MTITRIVPHLTRTLLFGALAALPAAAAHAWQAQRQPVQLVVPSHVAFQQAAQQQQARDQLQKSQLQQQLRQSVTDNAKRPVANLPRAQEQLDQADRAQRDRERAKEQALIDRERDAAELPRVVPTELPPPKKQHRD